MHSNSLTFPISVPGRL